jgi:hypothetical protein
MAYNALMQVINPVWISCYFGIDQILSFSLFNFTPTFDKLWESLNALCWSNSLFFIFFQSVSLLLNLCLCIDLILTMYSPFTPGVSRTKWYYLLSTTVPFSLATFIVLTNDLYNDSSQGNCIHEFYNPHPLEGQDLALVSPMQSQGNLIMAMILSIYIVVAIFSTVYSYRRLKRPGVSQEVRSMFFRKHFLYVCFFIFLWTIQQSQNYFTLFNPPSYSETLHPNQMHYLDRLGLILGYRPMHEKYFKEMGDNQSGFLIFTLSGVTTFTTGIFLTAVRLAEPLFRLIVIQEIYQFWGDIYEPSGESQEQLQIANDALSTFLTSSLNVELVFIILTSITAFTVQDDESEIANPLNFNFMLTKNTQKTHSIDIKKSDVAFESEVSRLATVTRLYHLKEVEIKNVDMWNSAKAKDFITKKAEGSKTEESKTNEESPSTAAINRD